MVDNASPEIIEWSEDGQSFFARDPERLASEASLIFGREWGGVTTTQGVAWSHFGRTPLDLYN
jgi:hypothetical protein